MSQVLNFQTMEIHINIGDAQISSISQGQSYNPEIYNDMMVNTLKAFDNALTIAVEHGYTFLTDDFDDDEDEDDDDNN